MKTRRHPVRDANTALRQLQSLLQSRLAHARRQRDHAAMERLSARLEHVAGLMSDRSSRHHQAEDAARRENDLPMPARYRSRDGY